jgi:P-type Ca2+ transporter type 2C
MSNTSNDGDGSQNSVPTRRPRAPTITIDTSAVSPVTPTEQTYPQTSPTGQAGNPSLSREHSDTTVHAGVSPTDARSTTSSEWYRESRPTSPHNVSSPTSKLNELHSNFLSVPGTRSRGNSIESENESHTDSFGGDTYVQSSPSHTERISQDFGHSSPVFLNDEEALRPDPGTEEDFEVEDNKFAFTPGQLNKFFNPKSLGALHAVGGMAGLEKGLRSDRNSGLSVDEAYLDGTVSFEDAVSGGQQSQQPKAVSRIDTQKTQSSRHTRTDAAYADRKRVFGANQLPEKKIKTIWELAWIAYNDKVLILLSVAAVISLALGIYQSVTATDGEARVEWVEGVAIMVAILIVVSVGAINDYQKELQFAKLNKKKEDRRIKLIRSGKTVEISVHDVLVGDVVLLEPGDLVPVDGILIEGHDIRCDESSTTGESDVLRKHAADDVYQAIENRESLNKLDPFILSGAKISEGVGKFMVTAVGVHSVYGKTLMSLQDEGQTTPLQSKLNVLAEYIAKLGLASGLLLFVVLFIKFLVQLKHYDTSGEKGQAFLQIFIVAVTIVVVAVPEGLPLAVTLALAFATTRMLKDNNLVRLLRACETMGNATTICSDKTGTLTQNVMKVVSGCLGTSNRFLDKQKVESQSTEYIDSDTAEVSPSTLVSSLSPEIKELLLDSIVLNSTAFEAQEDDGRPTFVGSKTESALLTFARDYMGLGNLNEGRSNADMVQMVPFDSGRKCMAVIIKKKEGQYRMFVKGASEILLAKSSRVISNLEKGLNAVPISEDARTGLLNIANSYASRSLRAVSLLYRDFEQWPPRGAPTQQGERNLAEFDAVFENMTLIGVFGIQDPLRPGVTDAVYQCQSAGVFVRMVTGDNINTAKAIAQECGIYTSGGVAMEGPKFRKLSKKQMDQIIPRLQVLARSSPEDKKTLVSALIRLGETVAVTGDGSNDAAALKTADVGFAMGIAGTEVAKEASDIILMDDNFTSIVKAMSWGRTVNDAVKKFLQFQITVNITAVILTFVSAVASGDESSVLSAVQLLWVNLIMDTFAALALGKFFPDSYFPLFEKYKAC